MILINPLSLRSILALTLIAGVSACQSTGMPVSEAPTQSEPAKYLASAEVIALRDSYIAANPGADGLPLRRLGKRGFTLYADDTMGFTGFRSKRPLGLKSGLVSRKSNEVCMDAIDAWTGACLKLLDMGDGRLKVFYEFGNGAKGSYIAKNIQI